MCCFMLINQKLKIAKQKKKLGNMPKNFAKKNTNLSIIGWNLKRSKALWLENRCFKIRSVWSNFCGIGRLTKLNGWFHKCSLYCWHVVDRVGCISDWHMAYLAHSNCWLRLMMFGIRFVSPSILYRLAMFFSLRFSFHSHFLFLFISIIHS